MAAKKSTAPRKRGRPPKLEGEKKIYCAPKPDVKTRAKTKGAKKEKLVTRPKKTFTEDQWKQIDNLCKIQCTGEEIASLMCVDYDTLNAILKREKGVGFSDYFRIKSDGGKASLRRRQWLTADGGNVAMQIWLGKQWLGQTDKMEQSGPNGGPVQVIEKRYVNASNTDS